MKSDWLPDATLRAASLLAPGNRRAEWLEEWRSELWYIPRRGSARFCAGAFRDALWVRRNDPAQQTGMRLESPLACLALLAALAAVGALVAVGLPAPHASRPSGYRWVRDLPQGCAAMLLLSSLLLPATWLGMGRAGTSRHATSWPNRLRSGIFLALKLALVQPIMLGGFVVLIWMGPLVPMAPPLGSVAIWILTFRWVISDQRQRCPVCLRLLTSPVRIGSASHTLLEWYGAESACSRGHGMLQVPEIAASYSGGRQWLRLDGSWRSLFAPAAGARQP